MADCFISCSAAVGFLVFTLFLWFSWLSTMFRWEAVVSSCLW